MQGSIIKKRLISFAFVKNTHINLNYIASYFQSNTKNMKIVDYILFQHDFSNKPS